MRNAYFIAANQAEDEDTAKKSETDIRKKLQDSDEKAHKLFERHDPNRPNSHKQVPPSKKDEEE